jgi:insertion element IS1 protein InsB
VKGADEVFVKLQALVAPLGMTRYYTDHWGAYTRHLDAAAHHPAKRHPQPSERTPLT